MGQQVGGQGITTLSCYRVSHPSPTTGWRRLILSSADGALQVCQCPRWRACSPHEPLHCPHLLGVTVCITAAWRRQSAATHGLFSTLLIF